MRTRSKHLTRLLADSAAGYYPLPEAVAAAAAAADRARAMPIPAQPTSEQQAEAALLEAALTAVTAGKRLPDPLVPADAARTAQRRWTAELALLGRVLDELETRLQETVTSHAEQIIVGCLRPALGEIVAAVKAAAAVLPADAGPRSVLAAPEEARQAWLSAEAAARRYVAVRSAWSTLTVAPGDDERGEFREMANLNDLWPQSVSRNAQNAPPWPTEEPERLLWLVSRGAQLHVPTPAERQRLWQAKYGADVEQRRHNRQQLAAIGAALG